MTTHEQNAKSDRQTRPEPAHNSHKSKTNDTPRPPRVRPRGQERERKEWSILVLCSSISYSSVQGTTCGQGGTPVTKGSRHLRSRRGLRRSARFQSVSYDLAHFRLFCLQPPRPLGTPKTQLPAPKMPWGVSGSPRRSALFSLVFPRGDLFGSFFREPSREQNAVRICYPSTGAKSRRDGLAPVCPFPVLN